MAERRAGAELRQLRTRLGLTTRDVAELSKKIAAGEGNEEFQVSHARLIQIENDESTPSVYKLLTLSVVYGRPFTELVALYVDLEAATKYQFTMQQDNTRLASFDTYSEQPPVSFPVRFDPGFKVEKTSLVSRMVEIWGEVPVDLLRHLNISQAAVRVHRPERLHHVPAAAAGVVRADRRAAEGSGGDRLPFGIRAPDLVSGTADGVCVLVVRDPPRPDCVDPAPALAVPDAGVRVSERSRGSGAGDGGGGAAGYGAGVGAGPTRRASRPILILDTNNSALNGSQSLGMSTR